MLPAETRNRTVAFCILAVTGRAGGHALGRNAFSEYLLTGGYFWLSADQSEEERRALRVAAENITGVRRIEEHIVPASYLTASPDRR